MLWGLGMELAERITSRVSVLTGEAEVLRKQLADTEHELERLEIAGQVIAQLTADDVAGEEPGGPGLAGQRGFGLLVPARGHASGTGDLPGDYQSLLEAVAAVAAETGGTVTCVQAARRAGLDVSGRQSENIRANLKRLEDRGWLRRTAAGTFTIAP
jgi:post-segregation antitoxin (ccd killing protein)